jgi:hypothetical protein
VTATKLVTGAAILAAGTGPIAQHQIVHRERRPAGLATRGGAHSAGTATRGNARSTAAATRSDAHSTAPSTRGDARSAGPATRADSAAPATLDDAYSTAPATRDDARPAGGRPIGGGVEDLSAAPPLRVDPAPAPPAADVGSAGTRSPSIADTHDAGSPAR